MYEFVDQILERPKNQKLGIWIGSVVLLSFICWQYLYSPIATDISELRDDNKALEQKIKEQRHIVKNLAQFKEEVEYLDKKLELALYELPDAKQIPEFIRSISTLAKDSGLDIAKIAREQPSIQDFYAAVPVRLDLEGSYHKLATFFDEVGHLSRIVNIDEVTINLVRESKQEVALRVSCRATIFRYLSQRERDELDRRKSRKKKRKRK